MKGITIWTASMIVGLLALAVIVSTGCCSCPKKPPVSQEYKEIGIPMYLPSRDNPKIEIEELPGAVPTLEVR